MQSAISQVYLHWTAEEYLVKKQKNPATPRLRTYDRTISKSDLDFLSPISASA